MDGPKIKPKQNSRSSKKTESAAPFFVIKEPPSAAPSGNFGIHQQATVAIQPSTTSNQAQKATSSAHKTGNTRNPNSKTTHKETAIAAPSGNPLISQQVITTNLSPTLLQVTPSTATALVGAISPASNGSLPMQASIQPGSESSMMQISLPAELLQSMANQQLRDKYEELHRQFFSSLQSHDAESIERIKTLEKQLEEALLANKKLIEDNEQLKADNEQLKADNEQMKKQMSDVTLRLQLLEAKVDEYLQTISLQRQMIERAQVQHATALCGSIAFNFVRRVFKRIFPKEKVPTNINLGRIESSLQTGEQKSDFDDIVAEAELRRISNALQYATEARLTLAHPTALWNDGKSPFVFPNEKQLQEVILAAYPQDPDQQITMNTILTRLVGLVEGQAGKEAHLLTNDW